MRSSEDNRAVDVRRRVRRAVARVRHWMRTAPEGKPSGESKEAGRPYLPCYYVE